MMFANTGARKKVWCLLIHASGSVNCLICKLATSLPPFQSKNEGLECGSRSTYSVVSFERSTIARASVIYMFIRIFRL